MGEGKVGRPTTDRVGQRFGRLVVLRQFRKDDCTWAETVCDCGKVSNKRMTNLTQGSSRSCGCLVKDTRFSPVIDRVGQRFGRLVVLRQGEGRTGGGGVRWIARCDCGNEKEVNGGAMVNGNIRSCGCLHADNVYRKHGMAGTKVYKTWASMKSRCNDPKNPRYADYGGRGIAVCQEWSDSFEAWYEHVGPPPEGTSLDRVDVDGDYEPGNVRWASGEVQRANRRPAARQRDLTAASALRATLEARIAALEAENATLRDKVGWFL